MGGKMTRSIRCALVCAISLQVLSLSGARADGPGIHYPIDMKLSGVHHAAPAAQVDSAFSADEPASGVNLNSSQSGDTTLQAKLDSVLSIIGRGYNSFAREQEGSCIDGTIFGPVPTGTNISYSLKMITSYEEFKKDTAVEASLASNFGRFSFSIKSKFEKSQQSKQRSEFLLMKEYVTLIPDINLRNPSIISYYKLYDVAIPSQANDFYSKCGDSYVSKVQMGGELIALLTVNESSYEENSNLSIEGSAGGFSTTASASFNQKMQSLKQQGTVDVAIKTIGGDGRPLPGANLDDLIRYANEFPSQVTNSNGAPIGITTTSYFTLVPGLQNVSRFRDEHEAFDQMEQTRDQVSDTIAALREDKDVLVSNGLASVRSKGDVLDALDQAIAPAVADVPQFDNEIRKCETLFWQQGACSFSDRLMNYQSPPRPFVAVRKIDVRGSATAVDAPVSAYVEMRGAFCFQDTDSCWRGINGVTNDGLAYVTVAGAKYFGPRVVPPGRVVIRCQDSDYSDNYGDLYAFVYQK